MFSDSPGTPGRSAHTPRMMRSILHAGLGRLVQLGDDLGLEQRVHLGHDPALLSGLRLLGFAPDGGNELSVQGEGRLPQMAQLAGLAQAGELHEHVVDVGTDLLVAAQHPEVGVQHRRARVIVARAEVTVAAQLPALAAHHQRELGVRLVADDAVDHVRANLLELRRPVDIGLLVEAGEQLDDDGDFLAALRRVDQDLHHLGVDAGAVHGLLDGHDVGILRGLLDEVDHQPERLVRVVQQDVVLADGGEHVGPLDHAPGQAGRERPVLELRRVDLVRDLHQAHEVHRPADLIQVVVHQPELLQQELDHLRRALVRGLEPHRFAEAPLRQLALQRRAQVLDLFLVHVQVAVAGDAELIAAQHLHAGEQLAYVRVDDGGQEHETMVAAGDLARQLDHARQHARRLHQRDPGLAAEGVLAGQLHREVQALVEDARERVRRVEPDRREHRHQLAEEIVLDPVALRTVPLAATQKANALVREQAAPIPG